MTRPRPTPGAEPRDEVALLSYIESLQFLAGGVRFVRSIDFLIRSSLIALVVASSVVATASRLAHPNISDEGQRSELRGLVRAAGTVRTFEGRLTGGFAYGVLSPSPAGTGQGRTARLNVEFEAAIIDSRVHRSEESASLLEARGVASLLRGRPADAVADIEIALMRAPARGDWWSDLAAAYLVRAGTDKNPEDLVRALDAARRAVEGAPASAEARFNLALALEASHLRDAAAQAWSDYLEIDAASPWANEARARQQALDAHRTAAANGTTRLSEGSTPPARSCSQVAEWLWVEGLPRVADALRRADWAAADLRLADAYRGIGTRTSGTIATGSTSGCAGDRALLEAIVQHASRCRRALACDSLAAGFLSLAEGWRLEHEERATRAEGLFMAAARRFIHAGSPAALVAEIQGATAAVRRGDTEDGRRRLIALASAASRQGHYGYAGQAWLQVVNATNGFERLDEILVLSRQAFDAFQRAGDPVLIASGHNLMATFLATAGARSRAWEHRFASLALHADAPVDAQRYTNTLLGAARMALRERLEGAAAAYHEAALTLADAQATTADRVEVRIALAQTYLRLGAGPRAVDLVRSGLAQLDPDVGERLRAALDARLAAVEAELAVRDDPRHAIERATDALGYHERVDDIRRLPELLLLRARGYRAAGDVTRARDDLLRAASLLEGGVRASSDDPYAYFEGGWRLYADLVRIEAVNGGNARNGLVAAERILLDARTRQDYIGGATIPAQVLDRGEAIVRYLCLEDRWLAWVIDRDGFEIVQHEVSEAELTYLAQQLVDRMERAGSDAQIQATLSTLYQRLFAPLPDRARRASRLIVVADGPLLRIPFPTLWDARRGRYLVEDYAISRARSALDLLTRRARGNPDAAKRRLPAGRALVIGNPSLDRRWWRGLSDLPSSEAEARAIGKLYEEATVLTGDEATPAQVRRSMAARDVVHFGGHAVESSRANDMSLVLAPGDPAEPSSGTLSIGSLIAAAGSSPRLIVLAACSSGSGPRRRASGLTGSPELLLARGVEDVIASVWDTEDASTQRLMLAFHQAVVEGVAPVEALRRAQLGLVHSPDAIDRRPSVWGSFVVASGR
jgi:CHAT domain-containing protein